MQLNISNLLFRSKYMPRKKRTISSSGVYHVMLRSVNQQIIFEEDADYQKFLYILSDSKEKYDVDIYAYCLMNNHIHFLLGANPECLAPFFQSLGSKFVRWYNDKYHRYGHLFQDRFLSKPVEDSDYFLTTLVYIHNNPVTANICRFPSEYRWSSYRAFYGTNDPIVNLSYSCYLAGSLHSLQRYFTYNSNQEYPNDEYEHGTFHRNVSDDDALILFRELTGYSSTFEVSRAPKAERNDIVRKLKNNNVTNKQIARLLGISETTVKRICRV